MTARIEERQQASSSNAGSFAFTGGTCIAAPSMLAAHDGPVYLGRR